jgi:hypothetical protein
MDGLTFGAKINIAIGSYELISEEEFESWTPEQESNTNTGSTNNNFSMSEVGQLRNLLMNS